MRPDIFELNRTFQESRPIMHVANSCPHEVFKKLLEEVDEAEEALMLLSLGKSTCEEVGHEIADIMLFCCTLFNALQLNGDEYVREKIARNHAKYPAHYLQEGDYTEKKQIIRQVWRGDHAFFGAA